MTNRELVRADQDAMESHPVADLPTGFDKVRVWKSTTSAPKHGRVYMAFFNLNDAPATLNFKWSDFKFGGRIVAVNVYDGSKGAASESMTITIPAHGCAMYRLQ